MPRPPRPWLRLYSETLENRKAQELGRDDSALFVHWVNLLCLANLQTPRGYLPRELSDTAFALRVSADETTQILITLREKRFLDARGDRLILHDWKGWNPDSDANLTPARAKRNSRTPKEREKNALRTPKERIEKRREEKEEEEEESREDRAPNGAVPPSSNPKTTMADVFDRLPELQDDFPELVVQAEYQSACDWLAAEGKRKKDYLAFFRNWLRRASNDPKRAGRPQPNGNANATRGLTSEESATLARLGIGQRTVYLD